MSETGYTRYVYQWYGANQPTQPESVPTDTWSSCNFNLPQQTDDGEAEFLLQSYLRHYPESRILVYGLRSPDCQVRNNAKKVVIDFMVNAGFGAELSLWYQRQSW